jgi:hypothetical protein
MARVSIETEIIINEVKVVVPKDLEAGTVCLVMVSIT